MKTNITYLLVFLLIFTDCKKQDENNFTNSNIVEKKLSKITCTEYENDVYKGDSLMFEYSNQKISKMSLGANNSFQTYEYFSDYIKVCHYDRYGEINYIDTLNLNNKGQVVYSRYEDFYYEYNSDGYLIKNSACDLQIANGNLVKVTVNSTYSDPDKWGLYNEFEYYLDILNTNNFYQNTKSDLQKFIGVFGKPNRNLIKSITTKYPNGEILSQYFYSYEFDEQNVVTKIHESVDTFNVYYKLYYY